MTDPTALPTFPVATAPTPLPVPGPAPDGALLDRILDVLTDEGYRPVVDEDGDVSLKVEGQPVYVRCLPDSVPAQVKLFGVWFVDEDVPGTELHHLRAANSVTGALNLVKATVHGDRLVVAVDLLWSEEFDLHSLVVGALDALVGSMHTWRRTVEEIVAGT